jgi:hypothetical protein
VLPATATAQQFMPGPLSPVIDSPAAEFLPSADGDFIAWAANTRRRPNHVNAYFSQSGGAKQRVNPEGTQAETGGIDGTKLIYSEFTEDDVDLALYDMGGESSLPLPAGVNTDRNELNPSNSGDFLLFNRNAAPRRSGTQRVVLYNTALDSQTVIATNDSERRTLRAGQVNGDWAVFVLCGRTCNVFRYDILGGGDPIRVPTQGRRPQYAPSVTDAGVVVFARSASRWPCGSNVRYMTWSGSGDPVQFFQLPEGKDTFDSYFDDTGMFLYYDRQSCGPSGGLDVFRQAAT